MLENLHALSVREYHFIVGRHRETSLFSEYLENDPYTGKSIWNLYGTGGVGKSTLLHVFGLLAHQKGACFILLDCRNFSHSGHDLLRALLQQLQGAQTNDSNAETLFESVIHSIRSLSAQKKVVLAFDTFEEMTGWEAWLRENLLKWLPENVLVLIAGRYPLKGPWLFSPSWRERLLPIPIHHLNREDTFDYLRRCGINEEEHLERMWFQSNGHPLALSLIVAGFLSPQKTMRDAGADWFHEIAALWLKEVPDKHLRTLVEAAAMLQQFNQELLSYLLNEEIDTALFEKLVGLSFVQQSDRGWKVHDLMREASCRLLRERTPKYYRSLVERCAIYYANAILEKSGKSNVTWEVIELFHYVEDPALRAIKQFAISEKYYWERLTYSTMAEAQAYIDNRLRSRWGSSLKKIDPETGMEIQIDLTAEESIYLIQDIDLPYYYGLDSRSIQLLRSEEGKVVAIVVLVPLHEGTIPPLKNDPIFGPLLASMSPQERHMLETPAERPAGWFMRSMDYLDQTDPTIIADGMKLTNAYMCTRGIFVISPQPVKGVHYIWTSLGFEIVPGVTHCHYDGKTPTPYFILDTRGNKLKGFLSRLLSQSGIEWTADGQDDDEPEIASWNSWKLTNREQQVANLVIDGCSNADIAAQLFISETTVKKHLSIIFGKVGVKNRGQLIGTFMKQSIGKKQ
ncbi:MAG: LuxR C-terminal-related transcriptional regulator [Clostridia bacterium]